MASVREEEFRLQPCETVYSGPKNQSREIQFGLCIFRDEEGINRKPEREIPYALSE